MEPRCARPAKYVLSLSPTVAMAMSVTCMSWTGVHLTIGPQHVSGKGDWLTL